MLHFMDFENYDLYNKVADVLVCMVNLVFPWYLCINDGD